MELFNALNLLSFIIAFYILSSMLVIPKKTEAGKLFIFFCINVVFLNFLKTFINIKDIIFSEHQSILIFIQEIFIILTPYSFFLFTQKSFSKKLKKIELFGFISIIILFIWLLSGKVEFYVYNAINGTSIIISPYYSYISTIYINIMYLTSFYFVFAHYKYSRSSTVYRRYKKCFYYLILLYIAGLISDLIIPYILDYKRIAPITNILITMSSVIFYKIVIKKSLLYKGITRISNTIFSEIKEGVIIVDNNYKILYINEFTGFLFNIDINELINSNLDIIIPSILLKSEKNRFEFITRENRILRIYFTEEFINGIFSGYLLMIHDITDIKIKINELKHTQEKQREKLFRIKKRIDILNDQINENFKKYKKIIDINHLAIITIDQKTDLIENFNEKAKEIFGLSQKIIASKKFNSIIKTPLNLKVNNNKIERYNNIVILNNNKKLSVDMKITHFEISGLKKSTLIIKDLTEINKKKRKLLRINRSNAVGIIASSIAHDFNIINKNIKNSLKDLDKDTLPKDIYNMIIKIERALERSNKITEDLLRFIEKDNKKKQKIDISDIIFNVLDLMVKKIEAENIKIIKDINDFSIDIFPSDMRQLLIILIENAIHASHGKIERYIEIKTYTLENKKYISITDNGYGISSGNINEIFTPFFSTKGEHAKIASPLSKIKGIGLGLTVAEIICKENNINIDVESIPDIKTSFILSFK